MIIAFVPGAGGNRYLQMLLGNAWTKNGTSYDLVNRQWYEHRYLLTPITFSPGTHTLTHCMNSKLIQSVFPGQDILFIKSSVKNSLRREWVLHGHDRYLQRVDTTSVSILEHYNSFKDPSWPEISSVELLQSLPSDIMDEVNKDYESVIQKQINPQTKLEKLTQECIQKINSAYENITWHKDYYIRYPQDFSLASQIIDIDTDQDEFSVFMRKELSMYSSEFFDKVWSTVYE